MNFDFGIAIDHSTVENIPAGPSLEYATETP